MACIEMTPEYIRGMSDNDLDYLWEDCKELDHPLREDVENEIARRKPQPTSKLGAFDAYVQDEQEKRMRQRWQEFVDEGNGPITLEQFCADFDEPSRESVNNG